jgi:hypothetical protein
MKDSTIDKIFRAFCLFCITAGVLKIFILINSSFSYDELFTVANTAPDINFWQILSKKLIIDVHPPLYYFLAWLWNHLFTQITEVSLRALSAIFGVLSVSAAFFKFPKNLPQNAKYFFTALLSLSYSVLYYACDARPYALALLLSLLLTFKLFDILNKFKNNAPILKKDFLFYFLWSLLLTYAHYWGAMFAGACFLVILFFCVKYKRYLKQFSGLYGVVLLLFLPWLLPNVYLNAVQDRFQGNWWNGTIGNAAGEFSKQINMMIFSTVAARLCFTLITAISVWYIIKKKNHQIMENSVEILSSLFIVLFVFFATVLISLKINLLVYRYFITVIPCFYILITLICADVVKKRAVYAVLPCVMLVFMLCYMDYHKKTLTARDMAQALSRISSGAEQKIFVVDYYPPNSYQGMYSYYFKRLGREVKITDLLRNPQTPVSFEEYILMPHCGTKKIQMAEAELKIKLDMFLVAGDTCIIKRIADNAEYGKDILRLNIDFSDGPKYNQTGRLKWDDI